MTLAQVQAARFALFKPTRGGNHGWSSTSDRRGVGRFAILQAEKEDVEREILFDGPLVHESAGGLQECEPSESCIRDFEWQHRETLEERLRILNDAQDRLIDGGYGRCLECGEQINAKRLAADPAASLCLNCQTQAEAESPRRSM